jgi:hypothetical protein
LQCLLPCVGLLTSLDTEQQHAQATSIHCERDLADGFVKVCVNERGQLSWITAQLFDHGWYRTGTDQ